MLRFSLGDRVVGTHSYDGADIIGRQGEIVTDQEQGVRYGVFFKGYTRGHDLNGLLTGDDRNSGWNVQAACLQLLKPQTPFERSVRSYIDRELGG